VRKLTTNSELWIAKPVVSERLLALKFKYSTEGIEEMKEFCGNDFISGGKSRHPSAIGWIKINCDGKILTVTEGQYVVKSTYQLFPNTLSIMTEDNLKLHYQDVYDTIGN
jgi:hypothetical protein